MADVFLTLLAAVAFVLAGQPPAIATVDSMPLVQADKGAARVVGLKDLPDEKEEVAHSTLF